MAGLPLNKYWEDETREISELSALKWHHAQIIEGKRRLGDLLDELARLRKENKPAQEKNNGSTQAH